MSYDISASLQGQLTGAALAAGDRQREWQKYQAEMEAEMKRLTEKANTEIEVQYTIRERALAELAKHEPNHPLLSVENRDVIRAEVEKKRARAA